MRGKRNNDSSSSSDSSSQDNDIPTVSIKAFASGAQEVPMVDSDTSATVTLNFSADFSQVDFEVDVFDGVGITQIHLHCAPAGANGPVITFLLPFNENGMDINGEAASGTITNDDIMATACGENIAALYDSILEREVYLNVHSLLNAPGEVRGQVFPLPSSGFVTI
ncbi:MAG: hypothetical protein SGARI_004661 [Bacillariaceae sp.]